MNGQSYSSCSMQKLICEFIIRQILENDYSSKLHRFPHLSLKNVKMLPWTGDHQKWTIKDWKMLLVFKNLDFCLNMWTAYTAQIQESSVIGWNTIHSTHSLVQTEHHFYAAAFLSFFSNNMNPFMVIRLVYPIKW